MSKLFNGTNQQCIWTKGDVAGNGAFTIAIVAKLLNAGSDWASMINLVDGGDLSKLEFTRRGTSNSLSATINSEATMVDSTGPDWVIADGWSLVAVSKAAGTNTPTFTHYPLTGSPTHSAGSATLANATASVQIIFGNIEGVDWFNGYVAAIGIWNSALSDADRASLGSDLTLANWLSKNPQFLVDERDGFATDHAGTSTLALMEGVDDADDPPGWSLWDFNRPATAPTNLWDYAGILLFGLDDNSADMDNILDWCVENKFKWVALQCFNDTALIEQTQIPIWKAEIQSRDLIFGLWGVHHDDPTGDAGRASDQINLWEADFYIANAELEYKVDGPGTRAHSATFVNAFRALQPEIRSAFCTYGAIANDVGQLGSIFDANAGVMDFKVWYDNGFHFLPQAYASDPVYEVHRVIQHYRRCNVPFTHIHPMAGIYVGGDTFDGADYRGFFTGLVNTEWEMTIQEDGPEVFYKMQDTSGNPLDSSPSGLNIGTVVGTPDYGFAGILDHVSSIRMTGGETLSRAVFSTAINNMSAEYLFQRQAQGANDQKLFYNGDSGTNGWGLLCNTDGTFRVLCGGVAFQNFADSGGAFAIDAWYHIVIVRDATVWKYYLNGSLHTPNAGTGTPVAATGNFQINDSSIQIAGCMFAMYDNVLTAAQIARRYAWLTGNPCLGPQHTKSAYGFSLFLGETGGDLGTVVEQDYIDLGLSITSDKTAEALASVKQSGYGYRRRTVAR